MQRFRRMIEMMVALGLNRRIVLAKDARIFGAVRKGSDSLVRLGEGARVDGLEIHGRGTLLVGERVQLKNLYVDFGLSGGMITIGDDVYIANGTKFIIFGKFMIGPGSIFGPDVLVVDTLHRYGRGLSLNSSGVRVNDVSIGANCWIGARASVMPGVQIADDVVIGAASVVTRNCVSYKVYAGVPAAVIKDYE